MEPQPLVGASLDPRYPTQRNFLKHVLYGVTCHITRLGGPGCWQHTGTTSLWSHLGPSPQCLGVLLGPQFFRTLWTFLPPCLCSCSPNLLWTIHCPSHPDQVPVILKDAPPVSLDTCILRHGLPRLNLVCVCLAHNRGLEGICGREGNIFFKFKSLIIS